MAQRRRGRRCPCRRRWGWSLVAVCPISIRTPDEVGAGGNMLSVMRHPIGTHLEDPVERLRAVQAATSKDRVTRAAVGAPALVQVAEALPGALLGAGVRLTSL